MKEGNLKNRKEGINPGEKDDDVDVDAVGWGTILSQAKMYRGAQRLEKGSQSQLSWVRSFSGEA